MTRLQSGKLYKAGLKTAKLLASSGKAAFFVGGFVRNNLLKLPSDNIDIATDATPDEIESILNQQKIKVIPVGKKFGSILAIVETFPIEITTFRREGRYSDNRHPDQVEFIQEYLDDAKRRDFTINALYFDPIEKQIFDPTNGLKNLKGKLLKFVGDPKKRIDEDALRMLRGVRLATQLGFKLEKNSFAAIKTRAKYIQDISGERIKAELDKILLSANRIEGIKLLDQTGLLKFLIPDLSELKKFHHHSKLYHLEGDIFTHTLLVLKNVPPDDLALAYAALFHDTGKVHTRNKREKEEGWVYSYFGHEQVSEKIFAKFADRLKFPRKDRELILWLVARHGDGRNWEMMKDKKKYRYAAHPDFMALLNFWRADSLGGLKPLPNGEIGSMVPKRYLAGKKILKLIQSKQPLIQKLATGEVIMKFGHLKPGQKLGQKIEEVKIQILLGKIKNESDLKNFLD